MSIKYAAAVFVGILIANAVVVGQTSDSLVWQTFQGNMPRFSILMPRLPVLSRSGDVCSGLETVTHAVYSEEVIYELEVISQSNRPIPRECGSDRPTSKQVLSQKMAAFRESAPDISANPSRSDGKKIFKSVSKLTSSWMVDDTAEGAIYVMNITRRTGSPDHESRFIESLRIGAEARGIEIGEGAASNVGDGVQESLPKQIPSPDRTQDTSLVHVVRFQPRARYTDEARKTNTQGAVRLKITLLSNGSVGSVTPVSTLPHGLTEQAVSAAKKTVFIPKKVNGVNVSVIITRDYTFSIY